MLTAIHTILQLGLLYSVATLGTVVSFRFLRFPDLTVEGSFALGGIVAGVLIHREFDPSTATIFAGLCGCAAGMCTACWHRIFGINKFFAGIITMIALYTVNLRVLTGANVSLLDAYTLFGSQQVYLADWQKTSVACFVLVLTGLLVCLVFCSKLGLMVRAAGSNASGPRLTMGRINILTFLGLGLANFLAATAGAMVAQYQRFADVGMGFGVAVNVFASLFLGEGILICLFVIARKLSHYRLGLDCMPMWAKRGAVVAVGEVCAATLGMIAFMSVMTLTLYLGLHPSDTKCCAAGLLLIGMVWRRNEYTPFLVDPGELEK